MRINKLRDILSSDSFLVLGVTGKMASGKNFICSELEKLGFVSVDCDKEVHKVLEEKKEKIINTFSDYADKKNLILRNSDGSLNRRNLGALLFQNSELLSLHESIVYPALTKNVTALINSARTSNSTRGIIINATVLYKTPELLNKCDRIIYVQSNFITRFLRARKRDRMSFGQIKNRFLSQLHLKDRYKESGIKIITIRN
ncbi:MAG: dephospho-CoA kinase [Treponema sp.]|nr:dephospho-CoA kinase [Candidatus Treponema merdequi]